MSGKGGTGKSRAKKTTTSKVAAPENSGLRRVSSAGGKQGRSKKSTVREEGAKPVKALHKILAPVLIKYPFYHGCMPREECEEMLRQEGDFLLRVTTQAEGGNKEKADKFVISVLHDDTPRHLRIDIVNNEWKMDTVRKPSASELIRYLIETKHKLPSGAVIQRGVPRPEHYILHENVQIFRDKQLGEGNFGCVYQGMLRFDESTERLCAIKLCKRDVEKKEKSNFLKEARTMRRLDHPNIVRFYGVAAQEMPIMLLMEFCTNGALKSYCTKNPAVSDKQLLQWTIETARGMCYLHRCNVMHLDLAARNCLLGSSYEVKISDFGKSEADRSTICQNRFEGFAIKWMPPELLLEGRITPKLDVWSFGITTWEIYMRCTEEPYNNIPKQQHQQTVKNGCSLKLPPNCPPIVQAILKKCWTMSPAERPDFDQVLKHLSPDEEPPAVNKFETYNEKLDFEAFMIELVTALDNQTSLMDGARMADQLLDDPLRVDDQRRTSAVDEQHLESGGERRPSWSTPPGPDGMGYHLTGLVQDLGFSGNHDREGFIEGVKHAVRGIGHAFTEGSHHGGSADKGVPHTTQVFGKESD